MQDGNLHPDLFISEDFVTQLVQRIRENNRLAESKEHPFEPVIANIEYDFKDRGKEVIPVEVRGYDE